MRKDGYLDRCFVGLNLADLIELRYPCLGCDEPLDDFAFSDSCFDPCDSASAPWKMGRYQDISSSTFADICQQERLDRGRKSRRLEAPSAMAAFTVVSLTRPEEMGVGATDETPLYICGSQ